MSEDERELRNENKRLRDLIRHAWVHSNYHDLGYRHMTTDQKKLYCKVVGRSYEKRQEELASFGN